MGERERNTKRNKTIKSQRLFSTGQIQKSKKIVDINYKYDKPHNELNRCDVDIYDRYGKYNK